MQYSELLYLGGSCIGAMGSTNRDSSSRSMSAGTNQSVTLYLISGSVISSSGALSVLNLPPEPITSAQTPRVTGKILEACQISNSKRR